MKKRPAQDAEALRRKLKVKHLKASQSWKKKHPHAHKLLSEKGIDIGKIRAHSAKTLAAGTLAGTLLLASGAQTRLPPLPSRVVEAISTPTFPLLEEPRVFLAKHLNLILPKKVGPLNTSQEKAIGKLIESLTGIKARGTLEGEHLNTTFGLIGAEQHLPRFPGDTIGQHDELRQVGITASRGAWGWFASSKKQLSSGDVQREKYYVAVQTMYLPDWEKRLRYLRDWYKWRKVIVVNPENGNAVVAVIADAGPAAWTGKHFGGSPEVMNELGGPRYKKGEVILFFVDDPENEVPLGPVEYNVPAVPKLE